jgi:anti-sigma B factor antagonist
MPEADISIAVRKVDGTASILAIKGEITAFAEDALMAAYQEADDDAVRSIILNFDDLEYMNSSGIGLLVTLLIRTQRQSQTLLACGLNEHYQRIFQLTRLNEAIAIYPDEAAALAAVDQTARTS